jgi:membrane protein DedA with SNARE-associated domain
MIGAILGGTVMYTWGRFDASGAWRAVEQVPAVSRAMIERAGTQVKSHGHWAMVAGVIRGTPYKIYAVHAGAARQPLGTFVLISIPARLLRFAALTWLAGWLGSAAPLSRNTKYLCHIGLWLAFYVAYFILMPW